MNDILRLCSLTVRLPGNQRDLPPMLLITSSKPVNTASSLFSGDHLDLAAAGAVLRDDELLIDLLLQLSDMGDDPDESMPLGELRERLDRRMQ